ncbi:Protein kinase domain-containing protein [Enhydrobacter aerosaccus]|uniref:Protein kinase domain-containing protein n=1 Tax=Enhydrobacter aerosaccus TaxID=225324 RepID=A0A1T4RVJ8_9HYPH|nr:protein kinase [Enhydrobacter aerosaccus]SKA19975.1 Protein kinase domain-containing protein [Enhydrobacter aerosaccus]
MDPSTTAGSMPGQPPEVDHSALKPGQMIGRYEIVSVLGQGGFGITYRARDVQLGRDVAIKEYLPSALAIREAGSTVLPRTTKLADDFGWGRERFVSEGRTLATLHRTPAIVHVFDFLETNGTAYIVMELLSGETLEDRLKRQGKLGPEEIEGILWPLLDGLEQVHQAGFLHRDIKPANILLDAAGHPTLIDFGASRAAMAGRTTAMTAIFTPGYAAPEQMTSAKQGPPTDIYGLSATLYHAITGKVPPNSFERILEDTYEPLAQSKPAGFAPGMLAGIDAGLAVAARDRPQTIASWRPLLGLTAAPAADATVVMGASRSQEAARSGGLPPPPTEGPATPSAVAPKPRSSTALWAAIVVVVLAVVGGAGYYLLVPRGPDPEVVKARALAEEAEAKRKQAEEEAARVKAEVEQRQKAEEAAAARKREEEAQAAMRKQMEDDARRKIETELAEQRRQEEAAKAKAEQEETDRRKAIEDARKKIEFVAGDFDHFGKTLVTIALKDHADEIQLQGVDIVDDPALRQLAVTALAAQPRHVKCRQTDRLTDGTPLYRCLITPLNAKEPLADIPDADRSDLALALVRNGLVLASCDAPRLYADAEDDARRRAQSLWGRVKVPEYKGRCSK